MGIPKARLELRGRPILTYLLDRLGWPGPTLLVTAPGLERPPGHDRFTAEVTDPFPDQGPLRGLHTAVANASTDLVVATTVDMPNLERSHLAHLVSLLESDADRLGVMLTRAVDGRSQLEPFPCALRRSALPIIEGQLATQRRSVHSLAAHPSITPLPAPDWPAEAWVNLNHPEDLARFDRPD